MARWRVSKDKKSVNVTLTGAEQITIWFKWIKGSWRKYLRECKNESDRRLAKNLITFEKKHHIKLIATKDIGKFNIRFVKRHA